MPTTNNILKFRDWVWLNRPEKTTYTFAKALRDIENNSKLYQIYKQQNTMNDFKLQIFSPDVFEIDPLTESYGTPEEVKKAYILWASRFKIQGYYSANTRRIDLNLLSDYCTVKELTTGETGYLSDLFDHYELLEEVINL